MTPSSVQQADAFMGSASFPQGASYPTDQAYQSRSDYNDAISRSHQLTSNTREPVLPMSEHSQKSGPDQMPLPYHPVHMQQPQVLPAAQQGLPVPDSEPASKAHLPLTVASPAESLGVQQPNIPPLSALLEYHGLKTFSHVSVPYTGTYQRKVVRAQQACEQCRARKAKCDEGKPACSSCKEKSEICVYKEVPLHRLDKNTQLLFDRLQKFEDQVKETLSDLQRVQAYNYHLITQLGRIVTPPEKPPRQTLQQIPKKALEDSELITEDDGGLSIPVEHTTAAHKLLLWDSVKRIMPKVYDPDYVMRLEESRGYISVYGCGEIDETNENPVDLTQSTTLNVTMEEGNMHHPSPSRPGNGINQPQSKLADIGLDDAGRITTTLNTLRRYHQSYMEHLHKLHPFLGQKDLEQKIDLFIITYCPGEGGRMPQDAKRKRSCYAGPSIRKDSINNAIALLVFALGSICEVRDRPVPGPSYPDGRNLRNVDVIPGWAFYTYATGILGFFNGMNTLYYVQAALLAGLYAGQLARPFQSHEWISRAAWACQILVRLKRYEKLCDNSEKDLYEFAYWTCFQLESDILAELDLPASGISWLQEHIALPKGRFALSISDEISAPNMMMFFYSAQIYLRKLLNFIHTALYKLDKQGQTRWSSNVQEALNMFLETWRSSLPENMKWKDSDPPSEDINVARLRAKYYGARYIIHRPLLYHALHHASQLNVDAYCHASAGASSIDTTATVVPGLESQHVGLSGDAAPSNCTYRDLPTKMRRACKVCIESAVLSTEAFDGIKGRPIVTNIFGTAHAQFGNMLVLSATYKSNLSELVDRNDLERLLKRTIHFLRESRYISPSLQEDARILFDIYKQIFGEPAESRTSHYD